jgi:lipopolysaccharide/colanic/teichoic acid biosynthesis glycosyltransferase
MKSYHGKRLFDIGAVLLAAPLWIPIAVITGLVVLAKHGSPVVFRQERTGYAGRTFWMRKFRTMHDAIDADGQPLPDAERLTPFGQWLRSTSLDELPSLLNVLAGDMSLVGPRPLLTRYVSRYSPRHQQRHLVRPGLTGLAQVMGRNGLKWADKFELDVLYVEKCSFWLDLKVLFMTVRTVLAREGIVAAGDATAPEFTGYE